MITYVNSQAQKNPEPETLFDQRDPDAMPFEVKLKDLDELIDKVKAIKLLPNGSGFQLRKLLKSMPNPHAFTKHRVLLLCSPILSPMVSFRIASVILADCMLCPGDVRVESDPEKRL